ncbi:attacin-A-like isoform X2 [Malaya genurostris]|uniref:attacin-A-like isoform X2 n=1 Tax=Malaya genurostris TaxID=325434 RepID=UPI0026F3A546|nr:attacin-A-like isoform X2 [Malaya genurostris]
MFSGSLTPDYKGGNNLNLNAQHGVGNAHENVVGSLGLSANTAGGPPTGNLGLDYNRGLNSAGVFGSHTPGQQNTVGGRGSLNLFNSKTDRLDLTGFASKTHTPTNDITKFGAGLKTNDHGVSFSKSNMPGVGSQTRFDGQANLFKTDSNRLDANAFKTFNNPKQGPSFGSHGAGLDWSNVRGHGASVGFDRTPALKETNVFATGRANLWQNKGSSLDAFGTANRALSGPNRGRTDFGGGLGLSHRF